MQTVLIALPDVNSKQPIDDWIAGPGAGKVIKHVVSPYPGAVIIFYEEA